MFGRRVNAILEARGPNLDRLMNSTADIQRYLAMKTVVSLATGVLAGFLCWAAGLDFYILWGILAFALNFIPVLGSIIAGVPPFIVAFLVDGGPSALAVGVGYISINIFLGNFLEPMLMGRRFGLSTLVVIISVLFWGFISIQGSRGPSQRVRNPSRSSKMFKKNAIFINFQFFF